MGVDGVDMALVSALGRRSAFLKGPPCGSILVLRDLRPLGATKLGPLSLNSAALMPATPPTKWPEAYGWYLEPMPSFVGIAT
jgi:hypothetical protein